MNNLVCTSFKCASSKSRNKIKRKRSIIYNHLNYLKGQLKTMGKRSRHDEELSPRGDNIESRDDYKNRGKSKTIQQSRDEKSLDVQQQQQRTATGSSERNIMRKQSKIRDLLHSVKDDVIQKEKTLPPDDIQTDPTIHSGHGNFTNHHQRKFTRVSPQRDSNESDSKWKKAVQLSKIMIRPLQSLRVSREFNKGGNDSDEDTGDETNNKMMGLLRTLDHASCISSGILAGFLAINAVLWFYGLTKVSYTENFIRFYYSTTVVLTYTTLMGYLIRLYVSWTRMNAMILVHIAALLSVLIFHYLCKGYDLLRLECSVFNNLNDDMVRVRENNARKAYHCPNNQGNSSSPVDGSSMSQPEIVFILISQTIQISGITFILLYLHFTYVQPWLVLGQLGPKIKSRQIMISP